MLLACDFRLSSYFFFQAEDGIRDGHVTGFRRVLFRSPLGTCAASAASPPRMLIATDSVTGVRTCHDAPVPKIIGTSLAEHREKVRAKLFGALSQLMAESGFDTITLAQIAALAGVGRTSVYNHFPDKEAMLVAFIEHETEVFLDDLRLGLDQIADPQEQLRAYVREHINLTPSYHLAPGPELRSVVSFTTRARLRDHVTQIEGVLRQILADGIASGRFPEQDVEAVVPLINACLIGRVVPEGETERGRALAATEAFVLRAVGVSADADAIGA